MRYSYRSYRFSNNDESIKRAAYIKLRSKMQSILSKSQALSGRIGYLNSSLKQCLSIDNDIFESSNFNMIDNNIDNLISDINSTLSSINSHI